MVKSKGLLKGVTYAIVLLALVCCRRSETPEVLQEDLGFFSLGEAKDYILFKPGSYWVYKNSYTDEIDTMVLKYCYLDTTYEESKARKFSAEMVSYGYQSKRDGAVYNSNIQVSNPDVINFIFGWSWRCKRIGGEYTKYDNSDGDGCQFYYPFDSTLSRGNGVYKTNFVNRFDTLNVAGKKHTDIVAFRVLSDCSYPYPKKYILSAGNSYYYWAKHYGVVKIEHDSWDAPNNGNKVHMVWDLIESHIIP